MQTLMEKKWKIKPADEAVITNIRRDLNIHPAICRLLALRGVTNFDTAKDFFRPEPGHLHNPYLMKDMELAVRRIRKALDEDEKIMVYGDYDVDGTTAVAVVYSFLKHNYPKANLTFYIPHRYREGYGVSTAGIERAAEQGCSLIITLDCGIKSIEKAELAHQKELDMIICDHHLPGETLPRAVAILNPKQYNCRYPYKELSGCGIGYKLISALAEASNLGMASTECYLDLVATSIAADIVPISGENRALAFLGLQRANSKPCLALRTIREIAMLRKPFSISDLVFVVAPRINAAGRMDDARKAVEFFIEENEARSQELAKNLHSDNFDRKEIDKSMTDEALSLLQRDAGTAGRKSTVLFQPHWHKGVVGIVASRIIDHYYRPTIVLTESNGKITGSARSVTGFNIYNAIQECGDLLENYGGHFFAAGMTLSPDNLGAFRQKFEQVVSNTIHPDSLYPEIEIDAELNFPDITPSFFNILNQFEPFGPENIRPVFISKQVQDYNGYSKIVKGQHIRFIVTQNAGYSISGIGFGLADKFGIISRGEPFDLVYTIDQNEWNGTKSLQLHVLDVRPCQNG
jgi:single-stranded-DNA-specific exonuclease